MGGEHPPFLLAYNGQMFSFFVLCRTFLPFLFAPVPLFFLWGWRWSASRWVWLGWVCSGLFTFLYGGRFLPPRPEPNLTPVLTVLTFNVGAGVATPEQITHFVQQEAADLVALQELTPAGITTLQTLTHTYPYQIFDPTSGLGLMSRHPLGTPHWLAVSGQRPILRVEAQTKPYPTQVWVIHPSPPTLYWYKNWYLPLGVDDTLPQQLVLYLVNELQNTAGPHVVLGDFNQTEHTPAHRQLATLLSDAYLEKGWGMGWSFPNQLALTPQLTIPPLLRLDFVYHSAEWQATSAEVICPAGSDHCAVRVVLAQP